MSRIALVIVLLAAPAVALAQTPPAPPPTTTTQPAPPPPPQPPQPQPPPPYYPPPYGYYPPPYQQPPPSAEINHDDGTLELVGDFAGLGVLGIVDLMVARDYGDPSTGTLLVIGGALGGGGIGWMVADRMHVTRGEANMATAGLGLGLINGALLLEPLHTNDTGAQVLTTLLVGGAAGTAGGLLLGGDLHMTQGQSIFATNVGLLGLGSSAIVGALIDQNGDGKIDPNALTSMLIGLDGGAVAGLVLAPKVHWSRGRARFVGAASLVGTLVGGMVGTLLATNRDPQTGASTTNADVAASAMLVGMWGGFLGGIAVSSDWAPDPRFRQPAAGAPAPATTPMPVPAPAPGPAVTAVPMIGKDSLGLAAAGRF